MYLYPVIVGRFLYYMLKACHCFLTLFWYFDPIPAAKSHDYTRFYYTRFDYTRFYYTRFYCTRFYYTRCISDVW